MKLANGSHRINLEGYYGGSLYFVLDSPEGIFEKVDLSTKKIKKLRKNVSRSDWRGRYFILYDGTGAGFSYIEAWDSKKGRSQTIFKSPVAWASTNKYVYYIEVTKGEDWYVYSDDRSVTAKVNQLMYWPTTPKDGEYICRSIDGPFMNAKEFLEDYPNWWDYSKLPISSKEKAVRERDGKMQEDPRKKEGIVGTFCRTYSIQDALEKFLSNVYAPSTVDNRYDYIPGEGSCGLLVYDDIFAYSHHATDPAGDRTLNAFDLIRIHKFGDEDAKESFLKMSAFAQNDPLVKEALEKEKLEQAQKDFEEINSSWEEPISFGKYKLDPFPTDALPVEIGEYVEAVAESTQTPVDMAGTSALAFIATCTQGKYIVQGKADWFEPGNIFCNIIASPSERKSTVLHAIVRPGDIYEAKYNLENAPRVEASKMQKRILESKRRTVEDKAAKGQAEQGEIERIANDIAQFKEVKPLQLYVDDITTEKLVYLHATEGNVIHYGFIEQFIEDLGTKYHILEIAFDRWGAVQMTQDLEGMGFTVVPFGQAYKDMSPPTKEFYKLLMEGRIIHGSNPVMRWMSGNVVVDTDPAGNIKCTKAKSPEKIDGIVAAIMALDRCIRHEQTGSVYDDPDRGLLVF